MANRWQKPGEGFISHRFAVIVIAALFLASLAGWIAQELVPPDFSGRRPVYENSWNPGVVRIVDLFRLYDPFHSFWYRSVLALFFAVLVACSITRFRRIALRSLRVEPPDTPGELRKRPLSLDVSWRSLAAGARGSSDVLIWHGERYGKGEAVAPAALEGLFARVASLLRRRGLRVEPLSDGDSIRFAASSGRFRSPGALFFHAGIVLITLGGLIGSMLGWREMIYLKEGESAPLPPDSSVALRVEDFRIVTTGHGEIRDYVSTISVVDARGDTLGSASIEVNRPFEWRGVRIYQSSYTLGEEEYSRARLSYRLRGEAVPREVDLEPGVAAVLGDSAATVLAVRFIPDFRRGPDGVFSASPYPANPALEVEVSSAGAAERGWLFLHHREFDRSFGAVVDLALDGIEPVYYTGLELASNPGVPFLFAGFAAATLGLMLMYFCNPRVIKGIATREGLLIAGVAFRWKASFEREFAGLTEAIRREFDESG